VPFGKTYLKLFKFISVMGEANRCWLSSW